MAKDSRKNATARRKPEGKSAKKDERRKEEAEAAQLRCISTRSGPCRTAYGQHRQIWRAQTCGYQRKRRPRRKQPKPQYKGGEPNSRRFGLKLTLEPGSVRWRRCRQSAAMAQMKRKQERPSAQNKAWRFGRSVKKIVPQSLNLPADDWSPSWPQP